MAPPRTSGCLVADDAGGIAVSPRRVIVGYYEDGPNLVSMAMNDWAAAEPAWWLNPGPPRGGRRACRWGSTRAREAATGEEREMAALA